MTWQNPIAVIQILFKLFVVKVVISETSNTRTKKKKQDRKSSEFWVNWHGMTHSLIILHYQAYYSCLVSDFYLCNSGNIDPMAFSDEF